LFFEQKKYADALHAWMQAVAHDRRIGHADRAGLQEKIALLVQEQHLEAIYAQLSQEQDSSVE